MLNAIMISDHAVNFERSSFAKPCRASRCVRACLGQQASSSGRQDGALSAGIVVEDTWGPPELGRQELSVVLETTPSVAKRDPAPSTQLGEALSARDVESPHHHLG